MAGRGAATTRGVRARRNTSRHESEEFPPANRIQDIPARGRQTRRKTLAATNLTQQEPERDAEENDSPDELAGTSSSDEITAVPRHHEPAQRAKAALELKPCFKAARETKDAEGSLQNIEGSPLKPLPVTVTHEIQRLMEEQSKGFVVLPGPSKPTTDQVDIKPVEDSLLHMLEAQIAQHPAVERLAEQLRRLNLSGATVTDIVSQNESLQQKCHDLEQRVHNAENAVQEAFKAGASACDPGHTATLEQANQSEDIVRELRQRLEALAAAAKAVTDELHWSGDGRGTPAGAHLDALRVELAKGLTETSEAAEMDSKE